MRRAGHRWSEQRFRPSDREDPVDCYFRFDRGVSRIIQKSYTCLGRSDRRVKRSCSSLDLRVSAAHRGIAPHGIKPGEAHQGRLNPCRLKLLIRPEDSVVLTHAAITAAPVLRQGLKFRPPRCASPPLSSPRGAQPRPERCAATIWSRSSPWIESAGG